MNMKKVLMIVMFMALIFPISTMAQNPRAAGEILNQIQKSDGAEIEPLNLGDLLPNEKKVPANRDAAVQKNIDAQKRIEEQKKQRQEMMNAKRSTSTIERLSTSTAERRLGLMNENRPGVAEARPGIGNGITQKRIEISNKIAERKLKFSEKRIALQGEIKIRVENIVDKVYNKLSAIVKKLENLTTRLETKIADFEEKGLNTGQSKSMLDSVKTEIDSVTAEIQASKLALKETLNTEISKEDVRAVIDPIKTSIRSIHNSLIKIIAELKNVNINNKADTDDKISDEIETNTDEGAGEETSDEENII